MILAAAFCLGLSFGTALGYWLKSRYLVNDAMLGVTYIQGHPYALRALRTPSP
jgi:hypothetical protein